MAALVTALILLGAASADVAFGQAWQADLNAKQVSENETFDPELAALIAQALENNPEIKAARFELAAAVQRIRPAGALDDPMLETGVINLPTPSFSFRREDMTMKMLGLAQRFPYPGKRALRENVALQDADTLRFGLEETVNRVVRDVRLVYLDLALVVQSMRIVQGNTRVLQQFLKTAEARYAVGQGAQADVLKAQTQLSRMTDERIRLERDLTTMEADLSRLLGRTGGIALEPRTIPLGRDVPLDSDKLLDRAFAERPQLLGLERAIARALSTLELARLDYYPDFDVRFAYGQRDPMPDGVRREDLVSLTVAINLPAWRQTKRDPRVAEAIALRNQAQEMLDASRNELAARLRQQVALAQQARISMELYRGAILPQARLTVDASLEAYRVGRVDFLTLLDSQMAVFTQQTSFVQTQAALGKALAEIDFLTGRGAAARRLSGLGSAQ
jgi:outer membrane protein TolC